MTVTEKMYALIVVALDGVVPIERIKAPDRNNQGLARPYVVHYWEDVSPEQTQDEGESASNIRTWQYIVVIAADSYASGEALFHSLKAALVGNQSGVVVRWTSGHYGGLNDDTGTHGFGLTFRVSESL